jgi:hypothetical protein
MLKAALPELKTDWGNLHDVALVPLLQDLEQKLLRELQESVVGIQSDDETVATATQIVNLAAKLRQTKDN